MVAHICNSKVLEIIFSSCLMISDLICRQKQKDDNVYVEICLKESLVAGDTHVKVFILLLTPGFYFHQLSLKPGHVVWQCAQPILAASQVEQGSELESQHLCKDDHLCECLCNYVLKGFFKSHFISFLCICRQVHIMPQCIGGSQRTTWELVLSCHVRCKVRSLDVGSRPHYWLVHLANTNCTQDYMFMVYSLCVEHVRCVSIAALFECVCLAKSSWVLVCGSWLWQRCCECIMLPVCISSMSRLAWHWQTWPN